MNCLPIRDEIVSKRSNSSGHVTRAHVSQDASDHGLIDLKKGSGKVADDGAFVTGYVSGIAVEKNLRSIRTEELCSVHY